ncbi:hypothetical protein PCAR4_140054 [Paraburkholderia caribensis]|nr:hypothetical protein PCAR4_140054 [Paraburkholderia caribensis]
MSPSRTADCKSAHHILQLLPRSNVMPQIRNVCFHLLQTREVLSPISATFPMVPVSN